MMNIIDTTGGTKQTVVVPHITDVKPDLRICLGYTHVFLFFSSRLKIRISAISLYKKRFRTALTNDPVPPVISRILFLNIKLQLYK